MAVTTPMMFFWVKSLCTSALKMETSRFTETLVSTKQSTRRFNPEERNQKDRNVFVERLTAVLIKFSCFRISVNSHSKDLCGYSQEVRVFVKYRLRFLSSKLCLATSSPHSTHCGLSPFTG
jgi:hypothetical protein